MIGRPKLGLDPGLVDQAQAAGGAEASTSLGRPIMVSLP